MKLCCAGGGKMAEALIGGLIATGWASADEIGVVEVVEARRAELAEQFPGIVLAEVLMASPQDGVPTSSASCIWYLPTS